MPSFEPGRKTTRHSIGLPAPALTPLTGLALWILLLFGVWSCASAPGQTPAAGAEAASEASTEEPTEATVAETTEPVPAEAQTASEETEEEQTGAFGRVGKPVSDTAEPESEKDREWLVDEHGRRYYILTVPKDEIGVWRYLGDNRVRIPWGQTLELVNEDEDYFYVKRYDTRGAETHQWNPPPTEEELEAVAARYRVETRETDKLRFEPAAEGLPRRGQWRNGFVLADMNRDGHLDIVHGPPRKQPGPPWIFLGDSRGRWRRWSEASFPQVGFDYGDVAVADFNRDEIPDLAVTSHLRGAMVMVGDGKGRFSPWSEGIGFKKAGGKGNVFTSRTMEVVDWNQDGWMDLLLVGEGPRLAIGGAGQKPDFSTGSSYGAAIYLNQGDGTWRLLRQQSRFGDPYGDSVTVGDFDGDGRIDFATGSSVMGSKEILDLGRDDGHWNRVAIDSLRDHAYVRAVRAGDFDGDARDDLAVAYMSYELGVWRSGIDLLLSRPGGEWERQPVAVEESRDGIYALDTGDLDGDGAVDLVALTGKGAVWVLLGDGHGGFVREASPEVPPQKGGCRGYHVALVDIDDDGQDEMIAGFAGEGTIQQMDECPSGGTLRVWDVETGGTARASIEK
jgi:hypothetical protein